MCLDMCLDMYFSVCSDMSFDMCILLCTHLCTATRRADCPFAPPGPLPLVVRSVPLGGSLLPEDLPSRRTALCSALGLSCWPLSAALALDSKSALIFERGRGAIL